MGLTQRLLLTLITGTSLRFSGNLKLKRRFTCCTIAWEHCSRVRGAWDVLIWRTIFFGLWVWNTLSSTHCADWPSSMGQSGLTQASTNEFGRLMHCTFWKFQAELAMSSLSLCLVVLFAQELSLLLTLSILVFLPCVIHNSNLSKSDSYIWEKFCLTQIDLWPSTWSYLASQEL